MEHGVAIRSNVAVFRVGGYLTGKLGDMTLDDVIDGNACT